MPTTTPSPLLLYPCRHGFYRPRWPGGLSRIRLPLLGRSRELSTQLHGMSPAFPVQYRGGLDPIWGLRGAVGARTRREGLRCPPMARGLRDGMEGHYGASSVARRGGSGRGPFRGAGGQWLRRLTRLGLESTGDPFWFETLEPEQLRAVYGMLWAEDEEARDAAESVRSRLPSRGRPRPSSPKPDPAPPPGASSSAWATLMSMRSDRQ